MIFLEFSDFSLSFEGGCIEALLEHASEASKKAFIKAKCKEEIHKSTFQQIFALEVDVNMWAVSSPEEVRVRTRCNSGRTFPLRRIPANSISILNLTSPGFEGCTMTTEGADPIEFKGRVTVKGLPRRGEFVKHIIADVGIPDSLIKSFAISPPGSNLGTVDFINNSEEHELIINLVVTFLFILLVLLIGIQGYSSFQKKKVRFKIKFYIITLIYCFF